MKTSTKESLRMAGFVVFIFIIFYASVALLVNDISQEVEKAGGIKGVAISIGKDIKDISEEVCKH